MSLPPPPPTPPGAAKPPINYQAPGAHRNSQWVTDSQPGGHWMVIGLIVVTVALTLLGGIGTLISWYLGWW